MKRRCWSSSSPQITRVLEAPDFVEGVINLRGRNVPVVDLRKRLHLPAAAKTFGTCIIVVTFASRMVGFVVDSASELLAFPLERMEAPTEMVAGINNHFLEEVVYCDDRLLVILNLREILSLRKGATGAGEIRPGGSPAGRAGA